MSQHTNDDSFVTNEVCAAQRIEFKVHNLVGEFTYWFFAHGVMAIGKYSTTCSETPHRHSKSCGLQEYRYSNRCSFDLLARVARYCNTYH
jgi:hypothetical protein